jgi:RNA recognition motif-containing protein
MAKKLFVGNLSWNTTDDSLRSFFSQFGTVVSAQTISDRMTGKKRGFGFVEMSTDEEAAEAMRKSDGAMLDERNIAVKEAQDRRDDNRGGGSRNFGGGNNYRNDR